jgi:hypothetical protein
MTACTRIPDPVPRTGGNASFCLDGLLMRAWPGTLLDVLENRTLPADGVSLDTQVTPGPLVLLDGRKVSGVFRLVRIRSSDVLSVETLDPFIAVPEHGFRACEGPIVVVTLGGHARGVTKEPGSRLRMRCGRMQRQPEDARSRSDVMRRPDPRLNPAAAS